LPQNPEELSGSERFEDDGHAGRRDLARAEHAQGTVGGEAPHALGFEVLQSSAQPELESDLSVAIGFGDGQREAPCVRPPVGTGYPVGGCDRDRGVRVRVNRLLDGPDAFVASRGRAIELDREGHLAIGTHV
jgi:hypothetical protein